MVPLCSVTCVYMSHTCYIMPGMLNTINIFHTVYKKMAFAIGPFFETRLFVITRLKLFSLGLEAFS